MLELWRLSYNKMKQLPMFDLNYHYFDDWVKQTNRCICSTYKIAYETGQYIMCKKCDGFIMEKDKLDTHSI